MEKKKKKNRISPGIRLAAQMLRLVILLSGITGLVLFAEGLYGIDFNVRFVLAAGLLYGTGLWACYLLKKMALIPVIALSLGAGGVWLYRNRAALMPQLEHIRVLCTGAAVPSAMDITAIALAGILLLALMLFLFEFVIKRHAVLYLLITALFILAPVLGVHMSNLCGLCLFIFQVAFWAEKMTAYNDLGGKRLLSEDRHLAISSLVSLIMVVVLGFCFLVSIPLVEHNQDKLFGAAVSARDYVQNKSEELQQKIEQLRDERNGKQGGLIVDPQLPTEGTVPESGEEATEPETTAPEIPPGVQETTAPEEKPAETTAPEKKDQTGSHDEKLEVNRGDLTRNDGKVNRGDILQRSNLIMSVRLSELPEEPLYLKGFVGGLYNRSVWSIESDDRLLSEIGAEHTEWDAGEITAAWPALFYDAMSEWEGENGEETKARSIQLTPSLTDSSKQWDAYLWQYEKSGQGIYQGSYFEEDDMRTDWQQLNSQSFRLALATAYRDKAALAYTEVPVDQVPRLDALVKETPLTNLNEITAYILYVLKKNASYTLKPGAAPEGADIVEYFLFENHQGYCQHYASAATLMYRMYGIPARYVTGYHVNRTSFTSTESGEWVSNVTGMEAHAWTEIWMDGYGWLPIEVTPAVNGNFNTRYPGFDAAELKRIQQEKGWETERENAQIPEARQPEKRAQSKGKKREDIGLLRRPVKRADQVIKPVPMALKVLGVLAVLAVVAALVWILIRNISLYRRRKWHRLSCTGRYLWLVEMLHAADVTKEYSGDEREFPDALSKELEGVPAPDAARARTLVLGQVFGEEDPPAEEEKAFRGFCRNCERLAEERLKGLRRGWFHLKYKGVL